MKICGADIQGRDLVLVSVDRDGDGDFAVISDACTKLSLNGDDQETVRVFLRALAGFSRHHGLQRMAIRGRGTVGKFAGGAISFKIEGLIQSLEGCTVTILMPTTIAAQVRKCNLTSPGELYKYQHDAYFTACAAIMKIKE